MFGSFKKRENYTGIKACIKGMKLTTKEELRSQLAKNGANRTLMPVQFGHPCRFKSDSDVGNDSDILE